MVMEKYLWLTDIHLNFLSDIGIIEFCNYLRARKPAGIIITGDISTGNKVIEHLVELEIELRVPIYFVLGNHDLWHTTLAQVEQDIANLNKENLIYLSKSPVISLSDTTALIGVNGFCDARFNIPKYNFVFWMDWFFIQDFKKCNSAADKLALMRDWAYQGAEWIAKQLQEALKTHSNVILATHFPLYPETNLWLGEWYQEMWSTYNSSKIMYETVKNIMIDYPNSSLTVCAGHVHLPREVKLADNILMKVGGSQLGFPKIHEILEV